MNTTSGSTLGSLGITSVVLVLLTSSASAVPVLNSANGHYYDTEVFAVLGSTSWTTSKTLAEDRGGYLLTVTSADEQSFVEQHVATPGAWWAGGSDSAVEDEWRWMTGPEVGTRFWQGKRAGSGGHVTAPFNYANWFTNEPNSNGEDYLSWNLHSNGTAGWNDVGVTNSIMKGFIIEFDSNPALPEPSTVLLFIVGLLGAGLFRTSRSATG